MEKRSACIVCSVAAVLLLLLPGSAAGKGKAKAMPANVDKAAHAWLLAALPEAFPYLLQTEYGPLDSDHIYIVPDLGTWGAGRRKGKHQGTDFVIDMPPTGEDGRVHVGAIMAGTVIHLEEKWGSYGTTLFIYRDTSPKMLLIYAHLERLYVNIGDAVSVGDLVGAFGCTGNCNGLRGEAIRKQVHVEMYALKDSFAARNVDWTSMPLKQVRAVAVKSAKSGHGIDVAHYFAPFSPQYLDREALGDRYGQNVKSGGLDHYLAQRRGQSPVTHAQPQVAREEGQVAREEGQVLREEGQVAREAVDAVLEALDESQASWEPIAWDDDWGL